LILLPPILGGLAWWMVTGPLEMHNDLDEKGRHWLMVTIAAFMALSVVLVIFLNTQLDIQTLFIGRVQLIQSHAVYALWLGYGLIFTLARLEVAVAGRGMTVYAGIALVALLPLISILQNGFDRQRLDIVGGAEQNGHNFGWQFGHYQLRGAKAILEELKEGEPSLPNPNYPLEMEPDAIFYGGTDPGRFVPTYMIFSAKVRTDVFLITQNALADNTYMNVMRDLYGDQIWIPSSQDSNFAFKQYVEDVQAGRISAGAAVNVKDGRVSVQGVQGVMTINGILAKMIFEANKHKHAFYVEESYVINWMYPYMEPHGLIMKINKEPITISANSKVVKDDRAFWDWYTTRLLGNKKFLRDIVARKTFSKLRSAIAGIYTFRRLYAEAEYAFKQAIDLYPLSPEANFRLADIYMQQRKFKDARELVGELARLDPGNARVKDFLRQVSDLHTTDTRRQVLEAEFAKGSSNIEGAMELINIYRKLNLQQQFTALAMQVLNEPKIPPQVILQIGQIFANAKRMDLLQVALQKFLEREPKSAKVWIDLAAVFAVQNKTNESVQSLEQAVQIGGEAVRDIVRKDPRFNPVRSNTEFKKVVPDIQSNLNFSIPGI